MGKLYVRTIEPSHIRQLHNRFRDGTATDAIGRHLCHVALGECCVADNEIPGGMRFPTDGEIEEAKRRLVGHWNAAHGATP